jgi:hypothetical protein
VLDYLIGSGVSISNVSYTGATNAAGKFTCPGCSLGLDSGIIFSSGQITAATGPNVSTNTSGVFGTPGNALLDTVVAPLSTWDAALIEFDFQVSSDTLLFDYRFASEEYPEWVCNSYFDVFGFFVTGPNPSGGSYNNHNIALIPGTTLPVGINSVNPGVPGSSSGGGLCNLPNQSLAYSAYYIDNTAGTELEFDGMTVTLTAQLAVVPCDTYHVQLIVADGSDQIYDSGVMLKANSFSSCPSPPGLLSFNGSTIQSSVTSSSFFYNWYLNGNLVQSGSSVLTPQVSGCYTLEITKGLCTSVSDSLCISLTSILENPFPETVLFSNSSDISSFFSELSRGNWKWNLLDESGRKTLSEDISSGFYICEVFRNKNEYFRIKLVGIED